MTNLASTVSFDDYSRKYDLLVKYSPPYQAIGRLIVDVLLKKYTNKSAFTVLDIGGGTGNFSKYLLDTFPKASITLLEPNKNMLIIARKKLDHHEIKFVNDTFENFEGKNTFDVLLCIHALYLMPDSKRLISRFKKFMNPSSIFIVCDIGQEINVMDWTIYLIKENIKTNGIWKTLKLFLLSAEIKAANHTIQSKQVSGDLWRHDLNTFRLWFSKYYNVVDSITCYRGCSNFLSCEILKNG